MQRRSLLLLVFSLFACLHTVMTTDCSRNINVTCIEYIVTSKRCVSGCIYGIENTTSMVWYRCGSMPAAAHLSAGNSLCQQRQLINTSGPPYYLSETGSLCLSELNTALTGIYCYKVMANSSCNPVQVVIVGREIRMAVYI